jgi:hypothetical protein
VIIRLLRRLAGKVLDLSMTYAPDGRRWSGPDVDRLPGRGRCNVLVGVKGDRVRGYCYLAAGHEPSEPFPGHATCSDAMAAFRAGRLQ